MNRFTEDDLFNKHKNTFLKMSALKYVSISNL